MSKLSEIDAKVMRLMGEAIDACIDEEGEENNQVRAMYILDSSKSNRLLVASRIGDPDMTLEECQFRLIFSALNMGIEDASELQDPGVRRVFARQALALVTSTLHIMGIDLNHEMMRDITEKFSEEQVLGEVMKGYSDRKQVH